MCGGIKFSEIKVENGVICNGHHRYIASLLAGIKIDIVVSINTSKIISWESVVFVEDDWDTPVKIASLNQDDADYNNKSIEQIVDMLK
jgi:ParB-like chromosome segregation protein Spo0J